MWHIFLNIYLGHKLQAPIDSVMTATIWTNLIDMGIGESGEVTTQGSHSNMYAILSYRRRNLYRYDKYFQSFLGIFGTQNKKKLAFDFQDQLFMKKARKIYRVIYLVDVGQ